MSYRAYRRNTALGALHLQMDGQAAKEMSWAGGYYGIEMPIEGSRHQVEIAAPYPEEFGDAGWRMTVNRRPEEPDYEQEGLKIGPPPASTPPQRVGSADLPKGLGVVGGDHYFRLVHSHPRDIGKHVGALLREPGVVKALRDDRNPNLNDRQFG